MSYYAAFGDRLPLWAEIDEAWYFEQKPNLREEILAQGFTDLSLYHEAVGAAAGLFLNPHFDEVWYRAKYPEVREAIKEGVFSSGFEHYCHEGFRIRSPHWLFSEEQYRWSYAGYDDAWLEAHGYPNGYAHFLSNTVSLTLTGSPFLIRSSRVPGFSLRPPPIKRGGIPISNALNPTIGTVGEPRLSWFFDPDWYLAKYPEVAQAIAEKRFQSALHHYLTNDTPERFDPLPQFSESAYREAYPDVVPALRGGIFRSAYEHFLRHGAYEGRRPDAEIDLGPWIERFRQLGPMADREADHPFRQWMHAQFAPVGETHAAVELDERETRMLFLEEAEQCADIALRGRLDFNCQGEPDISVILVMRNQFALTMQALASLRANYDGPIEVITVDSGSSDLSGQIENHVNGLHVMRFLYNIGFLLGANEALPRVRSLFCLYLNNDVKLFPNAVANALRRLQSSDDIGAVGAKIIRSHMRLQEAGSIIWRDGASYGYRRQDDPNIGEANFVRDVDYCSAAFLVVRTEDARQLSGFDPKFAPAYFEDTDFCLRMLKSGKRIVYDPSVVVEHMESGSFSLTDSHDWIQINHRVFFNRHRQLLLAKLPHMSAMRCWGVSRKGGGRPSSSLRIAYPCGGWVPAMCASMKSSRR
ncbi:MAG: glycosyltransferase [Acetobacteraceae bacterium]